MAWCLRSEPPILLTLFSFEIPDYASCGGSHSLAEFSQPSLCPHNSYNKCSTWYCQSRPTSGCSRASIAGFAQHCHLCCASFSSSASSTRFVHFLIVKLLLSSALKHFIIFPNSSTKHLLASRKSRMWIKDSKLSLN